MLLTRRYIYLLITLILLDYYSAFECNFAFFLYQTQSEYKINKFPIPKTLFLVDSYIKIDIGDFICPETFFLKTDTSFLYKITDKKTVYVLKLTIMERKLYNDSTFFNILTNIAEADQFHIEFDSPSIVKLHGFAIFNSAEKGIIIEVMEYAEGGNLWDYLVKKRNLEFASIMKIFRDIIAGIDYLHNKDLAHGDIKPQNIFLRRINGALNDLSINNFRFIIGDLETLTKINKGKLKYLYTVPYYPYFHYRDQIINEKKLDIYAAGITLFQMANNLRHPFLTGLERTKDQMIERLVKTSKYTIDKSTNDLIAFIIHLCLKIDSFYYSNTATLLKSVEKIIDSKLDIEWQFAYKSNDFDILYQITNYFSIKKLLLPKLCIFNFYCVNNEISENLQNLLVLNQCFEISNSS